MPSTIIDSAIFQGIFSSDEMRQVWSDENRTQKYLDIEAALARVQGRLGLIPQEAADEIVSHCQLEQIDMAKLRQQTERIGYPILGVVSQLNALCRDKLGEYCHWGATTQDITDTATVLQIRDALAIVDSELTAISAALATLARKHRDTPMAGRSNLQQAIPITFGYKVATILAAVERHRERLQQLKPRVLVGEFADEDALLQLRQALAMTFDRAQKARHLVAEGHRNGLLQVAAADHRRETVRLRMLGHGRRDRSQLALDDGETFADLQHRGGVGDVLRRRTPMAVLAELVPAERVELRDNAEDRIADALGLLAQLGHVNLVEATVADDFVGRFLGDQADPALDFGQRGFDVEVLLGAVLVGPHLTHLVTGEDALEDGGVDDGGGHGIP